MRIISRKLRSELSRPMEAIKDSNGRRAASFIKFTIDHQVLTHGWNICASDVTFKLIIHRNWIMPFLSPSVFQRWAIDSGRLIEWTSPLNLTRIRPVHFGPIGRRWMTEATRLTCTNVHNRFHCGYWSINLVISPSTVQRTKSEKKSQDTRQDTKRWKEAFIVKQKHDGIDLPVFSAYLKKKEKKETKRRKRKWDSTFQIWRWFPGKVHRVPRHLHQAHVWFFVVVGVVPRRRHHYPHFLSFISIFWKKNFVDNSISYELSGLFESGCDIRGRNSFSKGVKRSGAPSIMAAPMGEMPFRHNFGTSSDI